MSTARQAMTKALDVLRAIRDIDSDEGIQDPDVAEAIGALETALAGAGGPYRSRAGSPRTWSTERNRWGFARGESVGVRGGRWAGHTGTFDGVDNSTTVYLLIDGARVQVKATHVEPIRSAS